MPPPNTSQKFDFSRVTPKEVDDLHKRSDCNKSPTAQHHTLGQGPSEAAPGKHFHNGADSPLLFNPNSPITGSRSTDYANILNQILNALQAVGMTNGTGP